MVKLFLSLVLAIYAITSNALEPIADPTRPAFLPKTTGKASKNKTPKKRLLTAIFMTQGNRRAIINDTLYKLGDVFAGKKIVSIQENKVLLKGPTGLSQLTLNKPIKKVKKQ